MIRLIPILTSDTGSAGTLSYNIAQSLMKCARCLHAYPLTADHSAFFLVGLKAASR